MFNSDLTLSCEHMYQMLKSYVTCQQFIIIEPCPWLVWSCIRSCINIWHLLHTSHLLDKAPPSPSFSYNENKSTTVCNNNTAFNSHLRVSWSFCSPSVLVSTSETYFWAEWRTGVITLQSSTCLIFCSKPPRVALSPVNDYNKIVLDILHQQLSLYFPCSLQ